MQIRTLTGVNDLDVLEVFNHSFADYFITLQFTKDQFLTKVQADKVDYNLSVGAFVNDKLVGFILHGIDLIRNKKVAYNGGTGVVPSARGVGLTKQMYAFILPKLREADIDEIHLEVIQENEQAIKSYQKAGFSVTRKLICYSGSVKPLEENPDIDIKIINKPDFDFQQSFWTIYPSWQYSNHILKDMEDTYSAYGAFLKNELAGYIFFNPTNNRILQIAVKEEYRRLKIASSLVSKLTESQNQKIRIINVGEQDDSIHLFLKNIGLEEELVQLEMICDLDS